MTDPTLAQWQQARNILCVRLDSLGDVLMTGPAMRALKESLPGRRISLLTSRSGAEAATLMPYIDETVIYDAPWVKATGRHEDAGPEYEMAELLRQKGFDGAAIFSVFSQNPLPAAFLCHLAGIPLRLAYCRENPYQMLTNWAREIDGEGNIRHEVRRQLDLAAEIGCRVQDERLSVDVPPFAHSQIRELLGEMGLDESRPWLVLHTGGTAPSRRYEPESFARVGRMLAKEHGFQLILTGDAGEAELVRLIQEQMDVPSISVAGKLSLAELAALIQKAPLLISNNSGPVHIAAAVGTPVVDLYALTNPQHTPWMVPNRVLSHDVPCKFCYRSICPEGHHNCLRLVTPEEVVQATLELSRETVRSKSRKLEIPLPKSIE